MLLTLLLALLPGPAAQEGASSLWAGLEPGAHAVGYRAFDELDASRSFGGERSIEPGSARRRPVRIDAWYPADAGGAGEALRFFDYVVRGGEDASAAARRLPSASPVFEGATPDAALRLLGERVAATRDASPAGGAFPLVLAVGRVDLQPSLCEFLASHGFVVASVAAVGPWGPRRGAPGPEDYEACARDLEFALARMQAHAFVDADRVGVLGFGGGGLFALPVVTRNAQIDAFVSYEAGLFLPAFTPSLEAVPGFERERFDAPLLHIVRDELAHDEEPALIETAPTGRTTLVYLHAAGLHHHDLSQAGVASTEVLGLRQGLRGAVRDAHRVRALCTLRFLQHALLGDDAARAWFDALENGDVFDADAVSAVRL